MATRIRVSSRVLAQVALIAASTILAGVLGLLGVLLIWSYPGQAEAVRRYDWSSAGWQRCRENCARSSKSMVLARG